MARQAGVSLQIPWQGFEFYSKYSGNPWKLRICLLKDRSGSYAENKWKEHKCQSRETSKETITGIQVRDHGGFDYNLEDKDKKKMENFIKGGGEKAN